MFARACVFHSFRHLDTPFLLLDPGEAARNVAAVRTALPGVEVFYALKANPYPAIAAAVAATADGFEVASPAEVRQLLAAGVTPDQMMCLHPVKAPGFVKLLAATGIDWLAVDAADEVEKVAALAAGTRVLVRVDVPNCGSRHPLGRKFGCPADEAVRLLRLARDRGLRPAGVTTHVGSQCEAPASWVAALGVLRDVCREACDAGMPPEVMSLGGGLPAPYTPDVPPLAHIGRLIAEYAPHTFAPDCRVTIEPGRVIAASAGTLVASVIGLADRADGRWAYLDAGLYHGLFETLPAAGGFVHPVESERHGPRRPYFLAGPTCDGLDTIPTLVALPEVRVGDRVAFRLAGAYSANMSCPFNGYPVPFEVVHQAGACP